MKENDYTANVIYKAAIDEEKEWRRNGNAHDVAVMDRLLEEVRELGYRYRYFADITNRENTEKAYLTLLLKYIDQFHDDYFSAALVGTVGIRGNVSATETILNSYMGLSDDGKRKNAVFYDNALSRIKDKRYLHTYLELLKKPEDAIKLPLTMIMLGKWQLDEAKPYFLEYLNSELFYLNQKTSDLVFISLEALSYYRDPDGVIMKVLSDKLNTDDKALIRSTQKVIKRLRKRNSDNC